MSDRYPGGVAAIDASGSVHGRGVISGGNGGGKTRRSGGGVGVVTAAGGLGWSCWTSHRQSEDNRQFPDGLTLTLTDLPARARSALTELRRDSQRGASQISTCWLGLEASRDGSSLFFGPAGAGGGGGHGGSVLPFGSQDVHGQRRQRREVVAAPARYRQSGGAEDGRAQALSCGA